MKIRAVTLTNVRHFAGRTASLSGIGDGITVLSEPNEFGKSTFFDALHAVFFEKHRSRAGPVKALQPHAGGAPEVTVTVDVPPGRYSISKRWLSRAMARVTAGDGRIVAQDDEAEAWIAQLLGAGPSGLLWVRQGVLGLEPDDKTERQQGLAARRDLLSSVAGEIDLMTGGRRMDAVLDRTHEAIAQLATATGKPKAGGEWARAQDEAASLAVQETDLREKLGRLGDDLGRRAAGLRAQAALTDPVAVAARKAGLDAAQAGHAAAMAHAKTVVELGQTVKLAQMTVESTEKDIARLQQLAERVDAAVLARDAAVALAAPLWARAKDLTEKASMAAAEAAQSAAQTRSLRQRLATAQRAQLAVAAGQRAVDLGRILAQAVALQGQIAADRAARGLLVVTSQLLAKAEAAQTVFDRVTAQTEAQAVTVHFTYAGAVRAERDGSPVDAAPQRLLAPATFSLPGIGVLQIDPGAARGADMVAGLATATAALADCLLACGAGDLILARQHTATAQRLDQAMQRDATLLADIAPDGLDALHLAHATALAQAETGSGVIEDAALLEGMVAAAENSEGDANAAARTAAAQATATAEARAQAEADLKSAERQMATAMQDAGDLAGLAATLAGLQTGLQGQRQTCADLAADLARLAADAPDLATAAAALARATSASEQARQDMNRLREDLAALNTRIDLLADQGIAETLDEVAGRRVAADARASRYAAEVQALARLRRALDDARATAREAYFGPVMRELEPLLAILHTDATLQIDDQTLWPVALTRKGQVENLDILSGGTREQLAILTRLAFARMFARGGQIVPVILDDALVHSDDDRIEAMFTALHRVAKDQQILVLTCRQRAFAALGGDRVRVVVTEN